MKTLKFFTPAIITSVFLLASCTETVTNTEVEEAQSDEVIVMTNVVANALSDRDEGMMASMYDMTATFSNDGIQYRNNRDWRGPHQNYVYVYNPETGVHSIKFRRGFTRPNFSKMLKVDLNYQYKDDDGGFIEFPFEQKEEIESIRFIGSRTGHTQGPVRSSEFERAASWFLTGFNDPVMSLGGEQTHTGSMTVTGNENRMLQRSYDMNFNLIDISIQKPNEDQDELEYLVTGLIEYEITLQSIINGEVRTREFSGVIELTGDGNALIRVLGLQTVFRLDLATGEINGR